MSAMTEKNYVEVDSAVRAAVGVDIGCGMAAVRTSLTASDLPADLKPLRTSIEKVVPHGRTDRDRRRDIGALHDVLPPGSMGDAPSGCVRERLMRC